MRYRFILAIPFLAMLVSCQPVNRNKADQTAAVGNQQSLRDTPLTPGQQPAPGE